MEKLTTYNLTQFENYLTEKGVAPATIGAFLRYIEYGIEPGGFATAIVSNDLKSAVARADLSNQKRIVDIITAFYNYAPSACWGSLDNYLQWIDAGVEARNQV